MHTGEVAGLAGDPRRPFPGNAPEAFQGPLALLAAVRPT